MAKKPGGYQTLENATTQGIAVATTRALVTAWKDADSGMAAVAEVIASAFAG
jgi:hypothetical protein